MPACLKAVLIAIVSSLRVNEKCIDQVPTEQREIQRTLAEPIEHSQRHRIT